VPAHRPRALSLLADTLLDQISRGESVEPTVAAGAFAELMRSLAPFVLAFEDAHEADEARLGFLVEVGRLARAGRGTAVVLTTRHEPPPGFRGIRVAPKTLDEVHAILEEEIGARVPEAAVDWIHDRAAGNPLFALEYFRHLARQGHVWSDGRSWHWRTPTVDSMPTTVEALLEDPIRRAREAPELATVLEARAALERDVDPEVLARSRAWTGAALHGAERALELRGLLRDGDFTHPLFREVTRATTPLGRRRELAQRAIRAFARTPVQAARYVPDAELPAEEALRDPHGGRRGRARPRRGSGRPLARRGRAVRAAGAGRAPGRRGRPTAPARGPGGGAPALLERRRSPSSPTIATRCCCSPSSRPWRAARRRWTRSWRGSRATRGATGDWIERQAKLRFAMGDHQAVVDAWHALPGRRTRPAPAWPTGRGSRSWC
jgi:hypothetical protein